MSRQLKLPTETVNITFHCTHHMGLKNTWQLTMADHSEIWVLRTTRTHSIMKETAKKEHTTDSMTSIDRKSYKDVQKLQSWKPSENRWWRVEKKTLISVDRLYIDGQLYRDKNITLRLSLSLSPGPLAAHTLYIYSPPLLLVNMPPKHLLGIEPKNYRKGTRSWTGREKSNNLKILMQTQKELKKQTSTK